MTLRIEPIFRVAGLFMLLLLSACDNNNTEQRVLEKTLAPITQGDWYRPEANIRWHWQLQGVVDTRVDAQLFIIDLFDTPVETIAKLHSDNKKVICYISAGSYESYRDDANQFPSKALGKGLTDYADERWLDIRSIDIVKIMLTRLDLAQTKQCDGVELDNVDAFQQDTGFALSADDQLAYNRFLANEAHKRGLAVALKNNLTQIEALVDYFDFAINEQCHEFDECEALMPFAAAGKAILNAEYLSLYVTSPRARETLCNNAKQWQMSSLVLPLALDNAFRLSCDAA